MADPLDALRDGDLPVAPSPAFAADLRRRMLDALHPPTTPTARSQRSTVTTITPPPVPQATLTPRLSVRRATEALAFYVEAFGAVETMRIVQDDGRIGHAEVMIGGATFQLADEFPEMGFVGPESVGGTSVTLSLDLADVDIDAFVERAVAAGATVIRPVTDQFYGNRSGQVLDPFGHRWNLATPTEQLSDEEIIRRAAEGGSSIEEEVIEPIDLGQRVPADRPPQVERAGNLGYFTLGVPDTERGKAFYGALFGWHFEADNVQPDAVYAHIENVSPPGGIFSGHERLVGYFRVADIQVAVAKVRELGGRAEEPAESPSGWSAVCHDDQAQPLHLWQPAEGY